MSALKSRTLSAGVGTFRAEGDLWGNGSGQLDPGTYQLNLAAVTGAGTFAFYSVVNGVQTQIGPTLTAAGQVITPRVLAGGQYIGVVIGFTNVTATLERVA